MRQSIYNPYLHNMQQLGIGFFRRHNRIKIFYMFRRMYVNALLSLYHIDPENNMIPDFLWLTKSLENGYLGFVFHCMIKRH